LIIFPNPFRAPAREQRERPDAAQAVSERRSPAIASIDQAAGFIAGGFV
jgi:hypothetical protein